jgi:uncharacterized protein (DUF1697 family)
MFRFIAFLRAINVGRGRTVKMQSLRQVFESLGFSRVATFIASGNVIFEATTKHTKTLERKIEKRLREVLGYEVPTFIRREVELAKIANYETFQQSKLDADVQINIIFLAERLNQKFTQKVMGLRTNTDASKFTDGRYTGCVAKSKMECHFLPSPLRRLSVGHSPFAGLTQSKRSPQNTVHRKLANNLV